TSSPRRWAARAAAVRTWRRPAAPTRRRCPGRSRRSRAGSPSGYEPRPGEGRGAITVSLETFSFCPRCGKALADRPFTDIEGVTSMRRACEPACAYVQWRNPVPVVGALVEHEGDIVLARNVAWPDKFFALV